MKNLDINPQFSQVLGFINETNKSVFLTGRAGTGKTTLLRYIRQNTFKQMAVVAPTGVAAINAGGSTIHSFFQFPFTPFLLQTDALGQPDYTKNQLPTLKYNRQRLNIFRQLELLIIDEVSMVRADLLDQIDITLRQTRRRWQQPFGGVQVLLIGDLYQLPPVVQPDEWKLLSSRYASPFFFESTAVKNNPFVYIELEKIYRQKDQDFIDILNKVRNNDLDAAGLALLNTRYQPGISPKDLANAVTLTTHNRKADEVNDSNLRQLSGEEFVYKARVEGMFSEKNYPADEKLVLKTGARVMFLKNNAEKNYYNGKMGRVTFLSKEKVKVKCDEDSNEIEVANEVWTNVTYRMNASTHHVEEDIQGTFTQLPLRHAWAITIHKSQGLTFDKLIIDAADAFSAGQVYVALSRCRSLSGITFSTPINPASLLSDRNVLAYAHTRQSHDQVESMFNSGRQEFIRGMLTDLFSFADILAQRRELGGYLQLYAKHMNAAGTNWAATLFSATEGLSEVAAKFEPQLLSLLHATGNPEQNEALHQRLAQAAAYFETELQKLISQFSACELLTESKEAADEIGPALQTLHDALFLKARLIRACSKSFSLTDFVKQKLSVVYPETRINVYASAKKIKLSANTKHPQLFRSLLLLRDDICNDEHKPIYMVASNKTISELCEYLPQSEEQLLQISGFGEARVRAWGEQFLKTIKDYISEHNIVAETEITQRPKKSKKKKNKTLVEITEVPKEKSSVQTLRLFKQGLTVTEIAQHRKLSASTVENHLAELLKEGELTINELVPANKQALITEAIDTESAAVGLNVVKAKLPNNISYAEIRFVVIARNSQL